MILIAAAATPAPGLTLATASAAVTTRSATLESGTFSEFSSINSGTRGTLSVDSSRAYEGTRSGHASTPGNSTSITKYARGNWHVDWNRGDDIWYGAAIYLPEDFYSRQQGAVDILGWDNWALESRHQERSTVSIRGDGELTMMFRNGDTGGYTNLVTPAAPLSAGAWHWIDVRQKLGGDDEAVNELWVDDQKVGSSTTRNWVGRPVTHHRVGLVAEEDRQQSNPLDLWFDRAYVSSERRGPLEAPSSTPAPSKLASMESGTFGEFSSINSGTRGTLSVDSSRAYEGSNSGHASTPSGQFNKYARGIWDVSWNEGDDVWYGGAIYLPADFYSRQQGDVDIIRWDNWALENRSQDQSGVTIRWDGKLALLFKNLDTHEYTNLVDPVEPLSEGGWHWIDVRQKFGGDGAAVNELWVDGEHVGSSTKRNWLGRPATHHRIGLVAQSSSRQTNPLDLWFDRAYVADGRLGPR